MVYGFGNNTRSNLEVELRTKESSYFSSGAEKKAAKAAREAERKYKEKLGIRDQTLRGRIKAFFGGK